jgi:hypothetical protein
MRRAGRSLCSAKIYRYKFMRFLALFTLLACFGCSTNQLASQCRSEVRRGKFLSEAHCVSFYGHYRQPDPLFPQNETRNLVQNIERSPASYYMEQERNIYCGIKPLVPRHCQLECIEGVWQRDCGED